MLSLMNQGLCYENKQDLENPKILDQQQTDTRSRVNRHLAFSSYN